MASHLTIPHIRIFARIGSKDAAERSAATSVHDRVAWESAVQIFLDLHIPILSSALRCLQLQGTQIQNHSFPFVKGSCLPSLHHAPGDG